MASTPMTSCGYCTTGNTHHLCPGGVRNGNGSIVRCGCGCEQSKLPRCTDCGNREPEEISERWFCIDRDSCLIDQNKRAAKDRVLQGIRAAQAPRMNREDPTGTEAHTRPASVSRTPRSKSGQCKCCGEATKGGKFLPGHDSKWLNVLVAQAETDLNGARAAAGEISPAFLQKLEKRIK